MRIIVTTDSHGRRGNLFDIIERHIDNADLFINLGDSNSGNDFEDAKLYFGSKLRIHAVAGNCDWSSTLPYEKIINANGKKVFFCHGQTYYVKHGYETLMEAAKAKGADIALFGHTHTPYNNYINGIHFFNPGAAADGRYGIIDITDGGIICIDARI